MATVVVTGPMRSGTRLLARLIAFGGHRVAHDWTHGTEDRYIGNPKVDLVVVILRDAVPQERSFNTRFGEGIASRRESLLGAAACADDGLWVTYEHLCAHPGEVIALIARRLGVAAWPVAGNVIVDQNEKWYSGLDSPSLGPDDFPGEPDWWIDGLG